MDAPFSPVLKRPHARRLREIYRSAGWPYQDVIEIELLAAGMLVRVPDSNGLECMRVTDAGIQYLAASAQTNRNCLNAHNSLVDAVALAMMRDGRLVWKNLPLRAKLPDEEDAPGQWRMCMPDVFSIRNSSKEAYLEPIVHEIKVSRADLLGDLKAKDKRNAYEIIRAKTLYAKQARKVGSGVRLLPGADSQVPTKLTSETVELTTVVD